MAELPLHQKAMAMNALAELSIKVGIDEHWYVSQDVDLKEKYDAPIISSIVGRGVSPDAALFEHWNLLTSIAAPACLVVRGIDSYRYVRWNGFMWVDVAPARAIPQAA